MVPGVGAAEGGDVERTVGESVATVAVDGDWEGACSEGVVEGRAVGSTVPSSSSSSSSSSSPITIIEALGSVVGRSVPPVPAVGPSVPLLGEMVGSTEGDRMLGADVVVVVLVISSESLLNPNNSPVVPPATKTMHNPMYNQNRFGRVNLEAEAC